MKEYQLVAENDFGETQYRIKLSMHDAPQGKPSVKVTYLSDSFHSTDAQNL